jgi:hypothetical protein
MVSFAPRASIGSIIDGGKRTMTCRSLPVAGRPRFVKAIMVAMQAVAGAGDDFPRPRQHLHISRDHGRRRDSQGLDGAGHRGAEPRLLTAAGRGGVGISRCRPPGIDCCALLSRAVILA